MIIETMSVSEAAEHLGVIPQAIYYLIHNSTEIQAVQCGKKNLRIIKSDVEKYKPRNDIRTSKTEGLEGE